MKIVNRIEKRIVTPAEMKDGEIGVIVKWGCEGGYIGRILQRHDNRLITFGMDSGKSFLDCTGLISEDYQIEILPAGTLLEI